MFQCTYLYDPVSVPLLCTCTRTRSCMSPEHMRSVPVKQTAFGVLWITPCASNGLSNSALQALFPFWIYGIGRSRFLVGTRYV